MKFNINELDPIRLADRIDHEANLIFGCEGSRRGRSLDEIGACCRVGLAAELYMIDFCGFKDDDSPYKDLIDPDGVSVEIKVTTKAEYVKYVLERLVKAKREKWRDISDVVYVFVADDGVYELDGVYNWVDGCWIKEYDN